MRLKYIVMACIMLSFAGCDKPGVQALKKDRDQSQFMLVTHFLPLKQVQEICTKLGLQYKVNGCNTYDSSTNVCTIYAEPQEYQEDHKNLATIGHEVWHCRYGKWHD